jgi:hypothetical protein
MVGWADTVESAKFTSAELAALVAEAVSWWKQQREKFLPHGIPLSSAQKMQLKPFFTMEILDGVRIVKLPQTGETIPTPPFYEKILAASSSLLPDPVHTTAMPFMDVAVFNIEPTPRDIFHMLVHVTQLAVVGLDRVLEGYFQTSILLVCGQEIRSKSRLTAWMHATQETPPTPSRWRKKSESCCAANAIIKASHFHLDV